MKLTRHKVRLTLGLLTCGVGLFFILPADWIPFLSRGPIFYRFIDGAAWLLVGALLCLSPEFHLKLTHQIFVLALGLLMTGAGLCFTVAAMMVLFGPRAHGLLRFYELIGIGPLLITAGFLICFQPKKAGQPYS